MLKVIEKSYFKFQIIIVFSLISALLVGVTAKASYDFVRKIFLEQISEQTELLTKILASNLEKKYLDFLEPNDKSSVAKNYYQKILKSEVEKMQLNTAFIFDSSFVVLADQTKITSEKETRLLLNRKEIKELKIGEVTTSLPFKSENGKWFLWGFYRFSEKHWLCTQENANRLEHIENLSVYFWWIGIAGTLLTVFVSWFLAKNLTKPIYELVSFSALLEGGNFKATLPEKIKGELLILAKAMDKMREGLANKQREKEQMLAQIAHEIQNPLGGIELLAGLVREDLPKNSKNIVYLEKISSEILGLKTLITAYLNFSRPIKANREPVEIKKAVDEAFFLLSDKFESKKTNLIFEGSSETILFGYNQLKQVLVNLFSNSLEAIQNEGSIKISVEKNGNNYFLRVCDDGTGIKNGNTEEVFEPFFTGRVNGTGLGLAITRKICQENEAKIYVSNNEKKGCTFTIEGKN
ncbi:HAMP domain-containing histidine kinase [bacterium]|nr:HAMP domain-containing histidine kinase [bacterium]